MQLARFQPSLPPQHGRKPRSEGHHTGHNRPGTSVHAVKYAHKLQAARSRKPEAQQRRADQQQQSESAQPTAVVDYLPLVLVSLLWGSYTPALRFLYSMDSALTPQVLTAHRTVISAAALLTASAVSIIHDKIKQHEQQQSQLMQQEHTEHERQQHQQDIATVVVNKVHQLLPDWLQPSSSSDSNSNAPVDDHSSKTESSTAAAAAVLAAGLELGIWNFLGTSSQAIGLELSTATKAAFLTQTTAVFTPCLAVLCGQVVAPAHWLACIAALLGSCCITLDSLIDVTAYTSAADISVKAETVAAVAAVTDRATTSIGSSKQLTAAASAPSLHYDDQQPSLSAAANAVNATSNSHTDFNQSADAAVDFPTDGSVESGANSSSSSSSSSDTSSPVLVPAVTCSPTATPPQGVVPAISCAPVTNNTTAASSSSSDSSGSSVAVQQQQREEVQVGSREPQQVTSSGSNRIGPQQSTSQQQLQLQDQSDMEALAAADDPSDNSSSSNSSSSVSGELYILLACCCYAIATVRLSMVARGLDPVHLATSKTLALAAASMCWLLAFQSGSIVNTSAAAAVTGTTVAAVDESAAAASWSLKASVTAALASAADAWQLPPTYKQGQGLLLLVYSALGPGALAAVMQVKGQSSVSAAQAQVFYSLTPVWAAVMAMLFLQGEEMGPLAWIGGGVIVTASIAAAVSDGSKAGSSSSSSSSSNGAKSEQ